MEQISPTSYIIDEIRFSSDSTSPVAESLSAGREISLEIEKGQSIVLDPDNPQSEGFARVLEGLRDINHPAYLETDSDGKSVTRLLIPHVARVAKIQESDEGFSLSLVPSHGVHILPRDNEKFGDLEQSARSAMAEGSVVIVTEDEQHRIIDLRPFEPKPEVIPPPVSDKVEGIALPAGCLAIIVQIFTAIKDWIAATPECISMQEATDCFNDMAARSCNPMTVTPPCIPFMYPDDGCWGRAHEMCRLMVADGKQPKKVWIQGTLTAATRNNPNCAVYWGWHVAPTICVRTGLFQTEQMVIDPSLFTAPVTQAQWKAVQGDPNATLTPSAWEIFYLWGGVTDPTFSQTNQVLATYRLYLLNRSNSGVGPPPYANCP